MGLRINTNVAGLNTTRILRRNTLDLNRSLERLSSGLRINRAADDAAGLAIAESLRSTVLGARVAQRNAQDGISLVQTAEGALSETVNIIQRIRELAVQSANGTNSPQNRADLQLEVNELLLQVDAIANNTEFNNVLPLAGAASIVLQIGPDNGQTLTINFPAPMTAGGLGIAGLDISSSQGAAAASLNTLDAALQTVNTQRSLLGAAQNRIEFTVSTLEIQEENSAAAESRIRDADIARETVQFTRNQILVSAATQVLAQANIVPQTALQLLGG